MQFLVVLLLAAAASATNFGYSYAPSYSGYGGYGGASYGLGSYGGIGGSSYGGLGGSSYSGLGGSSYANLGGYASSVYGAPYSYGLGDSYSYSSPSYYSGYADAKPAVSYVSKPAIQKYVAPTVQYVSQPAPVSYVSKPAVQYVSTPRVEKTYTRPAYFGSSYQRPAAPANPARISFTLGTSSINRNSPSRSYTSKKSQVPITQTEYVPKPAPVRPQPVFAPVKPAKVFAPAPVKQEQVRIPVAKVSTPAPVRPQQVQIPVEVSQQQQVKTTYRQSTPFRESYDVRPGSKVDIGGQSYVVVPVADDGSDKKSAYTSSFVSDDKSSVSEGSFLPFPGHTYALGLDHPATYIGSVGFPENSPVDAATYEYEQPARISAGDYGSGYTQGAPTLFYGSDFADDKADAGSYGSEYNNDGASPVLYTSGNQQPSFDQGSSYAEDQTSGFNYGSDYSEDKADDSPSSYGSDYSPSIGSVDSAASKHSGVKNQASYGSSY